MMKWVYKDVALCMPLLAGILPLQAKTVKSNKQVNERQQPNVILILADDLGYGDLQCYGAQNVETPCVNGLADSGIRFSNAHAVASTSTPSRYSLLTGEYSWRRPDTDIAAGNAQMIIRPEQYTMADMFRSAGYKTGAVGKWHLGLGDKTGEQDWNAPLPCGLGDLGFDYHYIMAATGDRVPCVFIENGFVANYDPTAPIYVSYKENFPGEPTGKDNPELLTKLVYDYGHDKSIVNGISRIGYMKGGGKALWKDENIADSIAAHAIQFIEENQNQPFFLYMCTNDIHVPRYPHDRFRGKNIMGLRGDAIAQFDWTVGQVRAALERLGISENTLIILTSDNGPIVNDGYKDEAVEKLNGHRPAGPLRGTKYSAYEGGTTVPMIVSWPKQIKGGQQSDALISHIDYISSLASLVKAPRMPRGSAMDSQNHIENILGSKENAREWVIEQSLYHVLSVRTKDWKYIEPNDGMSIMTYEKVESGNSPLPQLYETKKVNEQENVAKQNPDVVFEMQNILRRERAKR